MTVRRQRTQVIYWAAIFCPGRGSFYALPNRPERSTSALDDLRDRFGAFDADQLLIQAVVEIR